MQCSSYLRVQSSGFLLLLSPLLSPYFQEEEKKPNPFASQDWVYFVDHLFLLLLFVCELMCRFILLLILPTLYFRRKVPCEEWMYKLKKATVRQRKRRPFIRWKDSKSFIPTILVFQQFKAWILQTWCCYKSSVTFVASCNSQLQQHGNLNYKRSNGLFSSTPKGINIQLPVLWLEHVCSSDQCFLSERVNDNLNSWLFSPASRSRLHPLPIETYSSAVPLAVFSFKTHACEVQGPFENEIQFSVHTLTVLPLCCGIWIFDGFLVIVLLRDKVYDSLTVLFSTCWHTIFCGSIFWHFQG